MGEKAELVCVQCGSKKKYIKEKYSTLLEGLYDQK